MKDEKLAQGFLHHHQQQLQLAQQQLASQKVGSVTHLLSFQKQTLPLIILVDMGEDYEAPGKDDSQTSFFRWFAANIGWFVEVVQYYAPFFFVLFL